MHNKTPSNTSIPLSLVKWLKDTFTPDYRTEIEHYLAESVNHSDLEQRIRTLSNRGLI